MQACAVHLGDRTPKALPLYDGKMMSILKFQARLFLKRQAA
jgi:hypothetical protein